ncbi:MAG: YfcE family phosphodiesterase [Candidatus Heimdallarchaeaceae archaeon]
MLVGIISDSHDNIRLVQKAVMLFKEHKVEAIIHAGDLISAFMIDYFVDFAPHFYLCGGNNLGDTKFIREKIQNVGIFFQEGGSFNLDGKLFVVYHGTVPSIVDALLLSQQYDYVIVGHTHKKAVRKHGKTILINPGKSFYDPKNPESTLAILNTKNNELSFLELSLD